MKTNVLSLVLATVVVLGGSPLFAAQNTYQVTGPILEVNDSIIAVQKGKERWEIARDPATKSDATMKVGDKVTVTYTMSAVKIELKADKAAQAEGKPSSNPAASPAKK